jgi:16S rRNA (uracil1498-N3)-methyltransferase
MRVSRIFLQAKLADHFNQQTSVPVATDRAHYIRNVLRLSAGDPVVCFDGHGGEYTGNIETLSKRGVSVNLGDFVSEDRVPNVALALGLCIIKRDAMDMAIQKATELGAQEIYPLISERVSVAKKQFTDRISHWQNIAISACEQCGMNRVPVICEPQSLEQWGNAATGTKVCGLPGGSLFTQELVAGGKVSVLVGPEGGFSADEQALIGRLKFHGIDLGPRILRAETAAISLATLVLQTQQG